MIITRISTLALVATLGLAGLTQAQTPPASPPSGPHEGMHEGMMGGFMRARAEMRLKAVHEALNIRPDQETAFQTFAASMKPGAGGGWGARDEAMKDHPDMGAMTAPERLDAMGRMMDEHMARMRERFQQHVAAVKAFYAVLSPEQKHTFDALPTLMGHPGMGMEPGGMEHGGPEGMRDHEAMGGPPQRD